MTDDDSAVATAWTQLISGIFVRLVGLTTLVCLGSLRLQVCAPERARAVLTRGLQLTALAGASGLYPADAFLHRVRADISAPARWLQFPAAHLWLNASDGALHATCVAGMLLAGYAVYGGAGSAASLFGCWAVLVSMGTVLPLLQYPWDCLLHEVLLTCVLMPDAAPLHSGVLGTGGPVPPWTATWAIRLLLLR